MIEHLVIDTHGLELNLIPHPKWGPAVMLVSPVTDALKEVEGGRVVGSQDRERVALVTGFAISGEVLQGLGVLPATPELIHQAVMDLGYVWEMVDDPLR